MGRLMLILGGLLIHLPVTLAQQTIVTPLFRTDLVDLREQEAVMVEVEYPPGVASAPHRHDAYVFVYVLEGSVLMQVEGGEPQTLVAGEVFSETPEDIHTVSMNASATDSAKILAVLVKPRGTPVTIPVN